jgi:predicted dinucleotide-binding enzyme
MKIGIIGAGQIGGALAKKLVKLGHEVTIANSRGPATLADVAAKTGARAVEVAEAVKGAELVVVTIPQKSVPLLPTGLFQEAPASLVVLDTGNYYPSFRDGPIDAIEQGKTESGWVADQIGRPVVKVFNNIMAHSLAEGGLPKGTPGRIALPVAGDDARAKQVVLALVDALGFDGVDAGTLADSWHQEPGTPVYCTDLDAAGVHRALAKANRARSSKLREESIAQMHALPAGTPPQAIVALVRALHETAGDAA